MSFQSGKLVPNDGTDSRVINAMLLDDSDLDRKRIRRMNARLEKPMRLVEAPSIEQMCSLLDDESFDLIMIDYGLTQGDGLTALDLIQKHRTNKDAATIMITGNEQTDIAVSAMKKGCSDFLAKPNLTPAVFESSVVEVLDRVAGERMDRYALGMPDTQDLVKMLSTALREPAIKGLFKDVVEEAMSRSAYAQNLLSEPSHAVEIAEFLSGMHDPDEFVFQS